jgi:hypothetical protein
LKGGSGSFTKKYLKGDEIRLAKETIEERIEKLHRAGYLCSILIHNDNTHFTTKSKSIKA